jgi:hypothetical protein
MMAEARPAKQRAGEVCRRAEPPYAPPVDWTGYQLFDAGIDRALREVSREDAERHFALVMRERPARLRGLRELLARNGVAEVGVQGLNDWLVAALRAEKARGVDPLRGPEAGAWYSLIVDLALELGEVIMAAAPHVGWQLFTKLEKATGYQRPVLSGFRGVSDPSYYVDVAHLVSTYVGLVCRGQQVKPDYLATLVRIAIDQA